MRKGSKSGDEREREINSSWYDKDIKNSNQHTYTPTHIHIKTLLSIPTT